jgi:hypothetical protein
VLGFTEAELGLFLALIFMGVAAYGSGTPTPAQATARPLPADSSRFAVVARLAAERDSLARVMATLGQRVEATRRQEARLGARRDSLAALSPTTVSAELARRTQLRDSLTRVLDSLRVSREATAADQRVAANQREKVEAQMEPIVSEEASILGTVAAARRQRDSILQVAGPADTGLIRRYARTVDSLTALAANPARRRTLAQPAGTATGGTTVASRGQTGEAAPVDADAGPGRGRSNQTPTCSELGVASGEIATIAIVGTGRFRVNGREGGMQAIRGALSTELAAAQRAGCRHVVKVTTVPGLAVEAYVPALVELRRVFNTSLVGPGE